MALIGAGRITCGVCGRAGTTGSYGALSRVGWSRIEVRIKAEMQGLPFAQTHLCPDHTPRLPRACEVVLHNLDWETTESTTAAQAGVPTEVEVP